MTRAVLLIVLAAAVGVVACETESEPAAPAPPSSTARPEPSAPVPAADPGLAAALIRGIIPPTLDDGTYRVDPFVAVVLYERLRARPDPFAHVDAEGAAPEGYRVGALEADDALIRLGLREGDIIEALNGVPALGLAQLDLALDAAENRLTVTIFREDLSFTNSYWFDGGLAWRDVIAGSDDVALVRESEVPQAADALEEPEESSAPEPIASRKPASSRKSGGGAKTPSSPSRSSANPRATSATSSDIRCADATSCTITERKFDDLRASPSALQSGVDIVPAIRNDVFSGYRLESVSSRSPVHALGFRAGDKITHVNGRDLTDDAQAMALYWSLGSSKVFKVRYERGGRNLVKTIRVV